MAFGTLNLLRLSASNTSSLLVDLKKAFGICIWCFQDAENLDRELLRTRGQVVDSYGKGEIIFVLSVYTPAVRGASSGQYCVALALDEHLFICAHLPTNDAGIGPYNQIMKDIRRLTHWGKRTMQTNVVKIGGNFNCTIPANTHMVSESHLLKKISASSSSSSSSSSSASSTDTSSEKSTIYTERLSLFVEFLKGNYIFVVNTSYPMNFNNMYFNRSHTGASSTVDTNSDSAKRTSYLGPHTRIPLGAQKGFPCQIEYLFVSNCKHVTHVLYNGRGFAKRTNGKTSDHFPTVAHHLERSPNDMVTAAATRQTMSGWQPLDNEQSQIFRDRVTTILAEANGLPMGFCAHTHDIKLRNFMDALPSAAAGVSASTISLGERSK